MKPPPKPTIVRVSPDVQQKGFPITIEIRGLPDRGGGAPADSTKPEFTVTIGGEPAESTSVVSPSGEALITALVPSALSPTDVHPAIYVILGDGELLRYEGTFSIQQEALATLDQGGLAAFLQRVKSQPTWLLVVEAVFLLVVITAGLLLLFGDGDSIYTRRSKRSLIDKAPRDAVALADGLEPIDVPDPPQELIGALRGGKCVAVLGPGMSVEAGMPTRASLLDSIIREALDPAEAPQFLRLLEAGRLDDLADSLNSVLPAGKLATQIALLIEKQKPRSATPFFRLAELPVSAVLSLNLDRLAAHVFRKREPPVFVPREAERCLDTLSRNEFFIFMLNGTTDEPNEILLSQKNLKDAISSNDAFRDLLSRLYYSRPLFFLGISMSGLQSFLQMIDLTAPPAQRHFALVEVNDSTWQPIARSLEASYGLSVMPFTPDKRDGAITGFLREAGIRLGSTEVSVESPPDPKIGRLELRNIGPFRNCDLELDPSWTVILGDNGVGKSTVLRALAVSIGGKATELSAARLLRSGESSGSITLHIGRHSYPTTIRRKSGGGVTIESQNGVPLDRGGVLAVGFSALRTVGGHGGKATEATPQRPNAADLNPLTSEEPDPRLDGVKQWIVRLDHSKRADGIPKADRERYGALYDRIFNLLGELAEGVFEKKSGNEKGTVPGTVNPNTGEITIKTKDGPVPFESLSQGTLSLVGWTGALMQRLYETAPAGADPLESPVIVLVDEIDAHMHPAWQQTLVERLSGIFENAQFIVTSHSPLVVGGLEPKQVYRFERDADGVVQISQPEYPLKGLGAAGLLTSGLFGLASHLDTETAEALDRKRKLTAKKLDSSRQFGEEDLEELRELERKTADVDFTSSVRDPMYKRFVEALSKAEAGAQEGAAPAPTVLTADEMQKKAELAEKIVRELMSEAGSKSQEESPP